MVAVFAAIDLQAAISQCISGNMMLLQTYWQAISIVMYLFVTSPGTYASIWASNLELPNMACKPVNEGHAAAPSTAALCIVSHGFQATYHASLRFCPWAELISKHCSSIQPSPQSRHQSLQSFLSNAMSSIKVGSELT